jgi:hypothetical protein
VQRVTTDSVVVCILLTLEPFSGGHGVALSETSAFPLPLLLVFFLVTFSHIKRKKPLPSPSIVTKLTLTSLFEVSLPVLFVRNLYETLSYPCA